MDKLLINLRDYLKKNLEAFWDAITPPYAFSWETLFLLSFFSVVMASATSVKVRDFLSFCGWFFLILGVGWYTSEKKPKIFNIEVGPWITGGLTSTFLYSVTDSLSEFFDRPLVGVPSWPFVSWPLISAAIAAIPDVTTSPGLKLKTPSVDGRQKLVILFLSHAVISCWIQFAFVIDNWLERYPTLLVDDFGKSAFVSRVNFRSPPPPRGALILDQAETLLKTQVVGQPWAQAERWLLTVKQEPNVFSDAVMQSFAQAQATSSDTNRSTNPGTKPTTNSAQKLRPDDDVRWKVEPRILPIQPDYTLQLLALWQGPSSNLKGYYQTKVCQITPVVQSGTPQRSAPSSEVAIVAPLTTIAKVDCQPTTPLVSGNPEPLEQ